MFLTNMIPTTLLWLSRLSNLKVNKLLLFTINSYELHLLYQSHHEVKPSWKNIKKKSYKNAENNVLDGYEAKFNEEDPHLLHTFVVVYPDDGFGMKPEKVAIYCKLDSQCTCKS